ncbi:MAG: PIG-L family deacetylase [Bacteroidia bacterium]|nr:PIG-L family deacetylase [Bacteroidia bacterium]
MMNYKILLIVFVILPFGMIGQELDVYVSAHPDDWQLFMNPNAHKSLQSGGKVIFLHTTAGDAGQGLGFNSYFKAREEGSLRAIRFLVNILKQKGQDAFELQEVTHQINGHQINRMTFGNAVIYFLRLPDGNYQGPGYEIHANKSLEKFYKNEVRNLHAIDSSTIYKNGDDFLRTLESLIEMEQKMKGPLRLHIAETDSIRNPEDHSDHRYSSHFMQKLSKRFKNVELYLYEEYASSKKPLNIFNDDFLISAGTWGATASGLSDMNHNSTWDEGHNVWIGRQYFRVIRPLDD